MTDEDKPTVREFDQLRHDMFEKFSKLDERMEKQDVMLVGILTQATKTNGRVNALEPQMADVKKELPNLQDQVNKQQNWKWYVMGASAAIILLGGIIYSLTIQNVNQTINQKISESQKIIIQAIDDQIKGSASNFTNSVSVN